MEKLSVKLKNCFGIRQLNYDFSFDKGKNFCIYARNGIMKTSFAKTFQKIQMGKEDEIKDVIFDIQSEVNIKVDGSDINKEQVFVINSYESYYESNITSLLVNEEARDRLKDVFSIRDKLLKNIEKLSGMKVKRTSAGRTIYELEPLIMQDFAFEEKSILLNIDYLAECQPAIECGDIKYSEIFDKSIIKKIKSSEFQEGIKNYVKASDDIYESFEYLEKGKFTLPKLKDLKKALKNDSFFIKENALILSGEETIKDMGVLDARISEIEEEIKKAPEYKKIEDLLSDTKGSVLKDIIEVHPEIIEYLDLEKLSMLKKALWLSYIRANRQLFSDLRVQYHSLAESLDKLPLDNTPWQEAIDIFDRRFTVPFTMGISNLKESVLGESVPQVIFSFERDSKKKTIKREKLEELDTLSQGEKRALYLLNIIFDIEEIKRSKEKKLLIIDDIADSFDYKNKYAIIEYLFELANDENFYIIILTHNFDFYRTVSSRLSLNRSNRLITNINGDDVDFEEEYYQDKPFIQWKNNPNCKNVIALIPFVRNLVEYGVDRAKSEDESDYKFLTLLLHEKEESYDITFKDILPLYKEYLGINQFGEGVNLSENILKTLYSICDNITNEDTKLENKIILSIAIRHKVEIFMIPQIKEYGGMMNWRKNRKESSGTSAEFLTHVFSYKNQTHELMEGYKQFGNKDIIEILDEVSIMTPEQIHMNSFMYEPLIDMDINELLDLYRRVGGLTD